MLNFLGDLLINLFIILVLWYLIASYCAQVKATEKIADEMTKIRRILEGKFNSNNT